MELNKQFQNAISRHEHLVETLGIDHPITRQVFLTVMEYAPKEFHDLAHDVAKEMDLIPDATGYLEDGTPMYSLNDIAAKHGISIEEAERTMHEMLASRQAAGLACENLIMDSQKIHLRQ